MNVEILVAIITGISGLFLFIFKLLIAKLQQEFRTFETNLNDFQKEISAKINSIDKSLAVKSNIIEYLEREVEEVKRKLNECKHCNTKD